MINDQFLSPYVAAIQKVIREIESDPATYIGARYLPDYNSPTHNIYVEKLRARGGMTLEHVLDTDTKTIQRSSATAQQFSPGAYREMITYNESDILRLREIGQNDLSQRGIQEWVTRDSLTLNRRLETRKEYLRWQAIFTGQWAYNGRVVDFGRDPNLEVTPAVVWGTYDGNGKLQINTAADPIADLRYWVMGQYAPFIKYKITKVIMNPRTANLFLGNPKVQAQIMSRFAAETFAANDVSGITKFLIPGMPDVEIYNGWYQGETVDNATGITSVGNGQYFISDGGIFFECQLPDDNKLGDLVMTLNLSNGDINMPAQGKFLIVEPHLKDQSKAPHINLVAGMNGGPKLDRASDIISAQVV